MKRRTLLGAAEGAEEDKPPSEAASSTSAGTKVPSSAPLASSPSASTATTTTRETDVQPADLMWSSSPQFSAQVRWLCGVAMVVYVGYLVLFLRTVKDDGPKVHRAFQSLSLLASSSFLTSGTINLLLAKNLQTKRLAERSPALQRFAAGSYSIIELVVTVNLIAGISHGLMAFELMPVYIGIGGRAFETARFAEWLGCIPLLVVLMHTLEDPRCAPPVLDGPPRPFSLWPWSRRWAPLENARWFFKSPHAGVWRACASMYFSTLLGVISSVWDVGPKLSRCLLFFGTLLYMHIFVILRNLILVATRRAYTVKKGDYGDDCRSFVSKNSVDAFEVAQASRERDRAARCVSLCFICCVTWTLIVMVYFGGLFGLYSITVEKFAHTCLDLVSKSMYATAVGHSYVNVVSPEVLLEKIIAVERYATDQRRRFLRYVMHEVRVPLNTVHLGVQTVIHLDEMDKEAAQRKFKGDAEDYIAGYEEVDDTDRRSVLKLVSRAIETMTATLDDTLSFAAIEEGHFELHLASFAIVPTMALALDLFKAAAVDKDVTLLFTRGEQIPRQLLGDSRRLTNVVSNFVSNALKFSTRVKASTVTLHIACDGFSAIEPHTAREDDLLLDTKNYGAVSEEAVVPFSKDVEAPCVVKKGKKRSCKLRVEVTDEGVGISEEDQRKLFEPFSQIKPGELQEGRGSGLGLAISKKIVELHGGEVGVRSTPGKGSTFFFHVTLPVVDEDDKVKVPVKEGTRLRRRGSTKVSPLLPQRPLEEEKVQKEAVTLPVTYRRRALVADDVLMNRKLLALSLKREGFECTLAADGQLAVGAFVKDRDTNKLEDRFCLICMDAVMPVMGGLEATRRIRKEGYEGLIIGCTGNALAEDIATFIEAGADSVITKPISLDHLRKELTKRGLATQDAAS